jgi:hypothetical protein
LTKYPQFELAAEYFNYKKLNSGSKLVFLRGAMVLNVDNKNHEIPLYFVIVSGFPYIAPKAFLQMADDKKLIDENPYIHKNMEILNSFLQDWIYSPQTHNLISAYYYLYKSFLIIPPIHDGDEEEKERSTFASTNSKKSNYLSNFSDTNLEAAQIVSKVNDTINKMNSILKTLIAANHKISSNSDMLNKYINAVCMKNTILESTIDSLVQKSNKCEDFIEEHERLDIWDVDDLVKPEEEVSEKILDFLVEESA